MDNLNESQFTKWTKDVFAGSNKSEKRTFWCDKNFIQGYFDELGKDGLIELCEKTNIITPKSGLKLIEKLTK